jgi:hypothetical protein
MSGEGSSSSSIHLRDSVKWSALALVLFAVISCASSEPVGPPTPTPDVPRFAEGEATAMVKAELRGLRTPRHSCSNELFAVLNGEASEVYMGNRVWRVSVQVKPYDYGDTDFVPKDLVLEPQGEWLVYETSLTISPSKTSTKFAYYFCGR